MQIVLLGILSDLFRYWQTTSYESIIRKGHCLNCVSDDVLLIYNQLAEISAYLDKIIVASTESINPSPL